MRRQRILSIATACTLPFIAAVCGEPGAPHAASRAPTVVVQPPELAITDGRDDAGIAHFYFLEPVDRRPKGQRLGPADRSLEDNLALEICLWLGDHCAQPLLARYTRTTGVGKERLQLDDDDDYYKVRWYTQKFDNVEAGQTYRLTVLAAGVSLGSADVKIVKKNKDLKKVDKDDYVGLKDDEGLTIRFYIERCGVYVLPAGGGSATPCTSGSVLATSSQSVAVIVPPGAVSANTKLTMMPATGLPGDRGLAGGPFVFTPSSANFNQPLTLSMKFDPSMVPSRVGEAALGAYEMRDGAWRRVGAASVDADHDRVDFDVAHFSQYAVLAPVASVSLVMPAPLRVGGTGAATATVKDAADRVLEHRQLDWSVFPAGIVSVDANGVLTALSVGEATVTVTSEGQRAAGSITVDAAKAASVVVAPASGPLTVGQTMTLAATAYDAAGAVMTGRTFTWSSSNDAFATVDGGGVVTGKAPGDATISATADGVSGSTVVSVHPMPVTTVAVSAIALGPIDIGATRQLTAAVYNGTTQLLGRLVTWSSSDMSIATVDANGLVSGKAQGGVKISATSEGIVGSIDLTVQLPPITAVEVTPASVTLTVGATQQLAAVAKAGTVPQPGRAVSWKSSDDALAIVDATGLVTAKGVGDATITATVEGISGTSAVTVKLPPITSVAVTPPAATIDVGGTQALAASAFAGTVRQDGRAVNWASLNEAVATVDASGIVTGHAPGDATINATVEGVSGSAVITVKLPTITAVNVTPASATLIVGATQSLVATALAGTAAQPGRAVTWSSSDEAVATVDAAGLVLAKAPGGATITATVEGIGGTSSITVKLPPITAVSVSPPTATMLVGGIQQFTATAMSGADPQSGRAVSWSSSDDAIASVDGNGLATAKQPGNITIRATVDGITGSSDVTVNPVVVPVTAVVVSSPTIGLLDVGSTRQLTAAAYNGTTQLFGRVVTWSSSAPGVMTVDGNGFVTAVSAGTATITALVEGVSGTADISTRGMAFGPFRMGIPALNGLFTGALRELKPTEAIALLDSARAAGVRLIVTPVSGRSNFKDPYTGRFDLQQWKYQIDRFNFVDFRPYIASGTIIGVYLIDEPMDPTNWVNDSSCMTNGTSSTCLRDASGAIIPDAGAPVSYADIDAAAAYAKRVFPGVPMGVGSRASELEPGAPYQNLDFGFSQYTTKKKDANGNALTASGFVTYEVSAAKRAGLGLVLSINVIAGNGGAEVLPSQLRSWGTAMAREPYACALTLWKWEAADSKGIRYNSYWSDTNIIPALKDVGAAAGSRAPVACRAH